MGILLSIWFDAILKTETAFSNWLHMYKTPPSGLRTGERGEWPTGTTPLNVPPAVFIIQRIPWGRGSEAQVTKRVLPSAERTRPVGYLGRETLFVIPPDERFK